MALFGKPVESLSRQRGSGAGLGTAPPTTGERVRTSLGQMAKAYGDFVIQDNKRRIAWDNRRFVTSSNLAQTRLNFELGRELSRHYPLDGREELPPEGYTKDLGFGVSLSRTDFIGEDGKKKAYPDIVDGINDRFYKARTQQAPSTDALSAFELRYKEGRLRAGLAARTYDARRQVGKMSLGMNSVIRSFRENISMVRGFDPATFAESIDALTELRDSSEGYVDPVAARNAFDLSVNDLLASGITESHTDKDNKFALAFLGATPLRNTETVKRAMAGLSATDQKYMDSFPKTANTFKWGDKLPDDVSQYIPWAVRQVDDKRVANLQARAVKSFASQTSLMRAELDARLKGIMDASTVGSGLSRDAGLREGIKSSIREMVATADRAYPEALYPQQNRRFKASALVASELLTSRDFLDDTPTQFLDSNVQASVSRLVSEIQKKVPQAQFEALPLLQIAEKEMSKAVLAEKKLREQNPYHVLQRTSKPIRVLENRLDKGDYVSPQEKALLQMELRSQVTAQSARLQVAPSFLTFSDASLVQNLDKLGDVTALHTALKDLRDKYGDETYFDFLVPQIANMEGVSGIGQFSAFIREPQTGEILSQAQGRYKQNLEAAQSIHRDSEDWGKDEFWSEVLNAETWPSALLPFYEEKPLLDAYEHLIGHVEDMSDLTPSGRARFSGAAIKAAKTLSVQYLATGVESNPAAAFQRATDNLISAIGRPMEFAGRRTIAPLQYNLNEVQNENLQEILRDPEFIRKELFPHVRYSSNIVNFAQQSNSTVEDIVVELLESEARTEWHFVEKGIHPVFPPSITMGSSVPLVKSNGQPLILDYSDLPSILTRY